MRHACLTDAGSPSPLRGRSRTCRSSAGAAGTPRAHVLPPGGGRRVVRADRPGGKAHGMYPGGVRRVRRHVRAAAVTDSVLTGAAHTELCDGELYDGGVRGASLSRHRVYPVSLCRRRAGAARRRRKGESAVHVAYNARCSALHDAGAPATPLRAFTSGRDVQKEHAHDAQKEDVHATMRRRRTRTQSFGAMRRRSALPAPDRTR